MAQALEEQRRQNDITDLDFEERLGLLIERQWIWKDNVKRSVMLSDERNYAKVVVMQRNYSKALKRLYPSVANFT